jgi:hypothetical protein
VAPADTLHEATPIVHRLLERAEAVSMEAYHSPGDDG